MVCKKLKKGKCVVLDEKCKKPYELKMGKKICAISKKKVKAVKKKTAKKKKIGKKAAKKKKKRR